MKTIICSFLIFAFVGMSCSSSTNKKPLENNSKKLVNTSSTNPYLSAGVYGVSHIDPGQTDAFPYPVPTGTFNIDLNTSYYVPGGIINIFSLASVDPNYMWSVSTDRVTYIDARNGDWKPVSTFYYPGSDPIAPEQHRKLLTKQFKSVEEVEKSVVEAYGEWPMARMRSGIYSVCDNNNLVFVNSVYTINCIGLTDSNHPEKGIELKRSVDIQQYANGRGRNIVGLGITYDGMLLFNTDAFIGIIDREFSSTPLIYFFGENEVCSNSLSVDEKNGIYIATDKFMRKLVWTGTNISDSESDGAWRCEYNTGDQPPTIKYGTGTGSTPSLMGFGDDEDKLVVITDGANNMNLVAFWRNEIPKDFIQKPGTKSNRIADQIQVTCGFKTAPEFLQSEQSVTINGYGAFVVNNIAEVPIKDKIIDVVAIGPVTPAPKGCERFEWIPAENKWKSIFALPEIVSTSMVPTVSTLSGIIVFNGYYPETGWEVTGLDWNTGEVVHRTLFGYNNYGNGAYAIMQMFPNGDMLFNSIAGPFRIKLK